MKAFSKKSSSNKELIWVVWLIMSIISCKVNGARIEVWEKIYDHWDLGNHGLTKECRIDPCGGCGINTGRHYVSTGGAISDSHLEFVQCISNNITTVAI